MTSSSVIASIAAHGNSNKQPLDNLLTKTADS